MPETISTAYPNAALFWAIETALHYLGRPYHWAGDDPSGFDCSGFVLECLKTAGIIGEKEDITADGIYQRFRMRPLQRPQTGALCLTINAQDHATHVVLCLDDRFQIGASGGGSKDATDSDAWRDNAYVKIRPINFDSARHKLVNPFA